MRPDNSMARRYHWHSASGRSFVEAPHTAICGVNQGEILNLADKQAGPARSAVISLTREKPELIMRDIQQLVLPGHHDVRREDVDLRSLGHVLWLAHYHRPSNFETLILTEGLGSAT